MDTINFLIFGEINATLAAQLVQPLRERPKAAVSIVINSYGGSVSDALGMLAALRTHQGQITIDIQGVAASAATLICCAGPVAMSADALAMIHAPWCEASGTAKDMTRMADSLDQYVDAMVIAYSGKLNTPPDVIRTWLTDDQDHWFSAEEALQIGLVDQIIPARRIAAQFGPLKPPSRFIAMSTENTSVQALDIASIQDAARREAMAAEQTRRREIRELLQGPLARRKELLDVMNACLDDMHCTSDMASERLLKKMGEGAESIGGYGRFEPIESIGGAGAIPVGGFSMPMGSLAAEFYASERSRGSVEFGGHPRREFLAAASDALAIRLGAKLKKVHPAAQDMRQTGLLGFASICVAQAGINTLGMNRGPLIKAAMTTSDLPELLSITAYKVLATRLEAISQEHRALVETGDLVDFKPAKVVNHSFLPGLVRKPEHGEIEYGHITDGSTTYQLMTFARGLAFSRELLINDDLDAIGSLLRNAATSGARLERDLIFSILTANPSMSDENPLFSLAHGNLDSSSAGLDIAGLNKARLLMRKQQDSSGGFVLTTPRFLIVPVEKEADAEALVASLTYKASTDVERETPAWVKGLTVISDPRLDAVSADDWYLLSDPVTAPTIRVGYLNGRDVPEVEQDADFDTDVLKFKIRFDVACAAVGWAGAVKMA